MLSAGARLGPYEILAPIGAGGMGEVYRARDTRLDRDVALKILREQLAVDPSALKRFEREAKAVAVLSHPNILDIHEFDTEGGVSFVVTELLEGETLRGRITRSPIPSEKALEISISVADGLAAAHSKGVIHRDLKPENIFLTNDGRVKILDFGLARLKPVLSEQELTQAETKSVETEVGTIRGTVPYMSPEQVRGGAVDARTDIFSFGCMLYEMLTGKRAFSGETAADTMSSILKEDPPISKLPLQLQEVVKHCLEKNPEQRFHSAHDLTFALKAVLRKPVEASHAFHLQRWIWIAAVLVVITLLSGLYLTKPDEEVAVAGRVRSIAVLPLANLSGEPQQEYFADGVTDAFIQELGQISGLRVISRTSVMQYRGTKKPLPEIGRELKVDAVLEGSILQSGNRVQITANLIEPQTERRLWSNTYERDLRDILRLRKEIASGIVQEIRITLTPEEERRLAKSEYINPEAYQLCLKGDFLVKKLGEENFRKAIADYQQAIQIDPNYAPAWAGLAIAYTQLGSWHSTVPPKEVYFQAKEASLKALELDDTLAEAHIALAVIKRLFDWDWSGADQEFKRGIEQNPSSSWALIEYANYLTSMKRFEESIAIAQRAVEIDRLFPGTYIELSWSYWFAGLHENAFDQIRKGIELDPNFHLSRIGMAFYYSEAGMHDDAVRSCEKMIRPGLREVVSDHLAVIGYVYAKAGKRGEALKILNDLNTRAQRENVAPFDMAIVHVSLGDKKRTLQFLEKSYEYRDPNLVWLKLDQFHFNSLLRDDLRFQDLFRRMKFPQ